MTCRYQLLLMALVCWAQIHTAVADEQLRVTVQYSPHHNVPAEIDPRTNAERLWLRFGNASISVLRSFHWGQSIQIFQGNQLLLPQDMIGLAARHQSTISPSPRRVLSIPSIPSSDMKLTPVVPRTAALRRIATVTFAASVANWNADALTDGLLIQIFPVSDSGEPLPVRGVLQAELYSTYRVPQNSAPTGRGHDFRVVQQWSIPIDQVPDFGTSNSIRLPFQANHPERDSNWSPYGLVHVELVAAGHGVFHHSEDGIRIRPYAPSRDLRQLTGESRYFPTESP